MVTQVNQRQQVKQVVQRRRARDAGRTDTADSRARVNRLARAWILGALVTGIGVGLFVRFYSTHFEQLATTDAVNVAQVAANVRRGIGLKSSVTYPLHAALGMAEQSRNDIATGPLYPLTLGMFFKGRGVGDSAVALYNGILFLLTAAFLYGLIKLVYDKSIAVWTVLAYFISMAAISQALSAGGATIGALMVMAALYFGMLAVKTAESETPAKPAEDGQPASSLARAYYSPWPWAVAAAIAIGLCYLTGQVGWIAIGGLVWLTTRLGERRKMALVAVGIIVVLLVAPWMVRNLKHFGSVNTPLQSYGLLMHTPEYPGRSFIWAMDGLPKSPTLWALTHPGQMLSKLAVGIATLYRAVPGLLNPYLFPFLVVGLFLGVKDRPQKLLWGMFWFILLAQLLTVALYDRDGDPPAVMTPLAIGLAVATLIGLMRERLPERRPFVAVGLAAAVVLAVPYAASSALGRKGPYSASKPALDLMASQVLPKAVIGTDIPWQVAWYGGHQAVLLPANDKELARLQKAGVQPDVLYLSRALRGARVEKGRQYWARLVATGKGVEELKPLGKPQMLPNGEAVITLQHAQKLIDKAKEKAKAAKAAAEGASEPAEGGEARPTKP